MTREDIINTFLKNKEIINIFPRLISKFPVKECINTNKEQYIFTGDKYYYCLIVNNSDIESVQLKKLKPYIWKKDNECLYGWLDKYDNFIDNIKKPIHGDFEYEYVWGWFENATISN